MIDVEIRGPVAVVHLRHGKANALDLEFCTALVERLEQLRLSSAGSVVLTGQGHIFSAGVDLLRVLNDGPAYLERFLPALTKLFETVFCFPKPVVAAINGHAIAGGCVLACAADNRIMALDSGRIGVTELLVGVPFPAIALEIMRFAAAPQRFQALVYSGATLAPEEAVTNGLVQTTTDSADLMDRAVATAGTLAALAPEAFEHSKNQICEPVMLRLRESGPRFDAALQEIWAAPKTLASIRNYAARTFKKSEK
jgi:enoyl-CoA hydratase